MSTASREAGEIIDAVAAAGIVGAGGAGFPSHVKAAAGAGIIIANGAECEPLLHSDKHLLLNHAETVIDGLELVCDAADCSRAYIALGW